MRKALFLLLTLFAIEVHAEAWVRGTGKPFSICIANPQYYRKIRWSGLGLPKHLVCVNGTWVLYYKKDTNRGNFLPIPNSRCHCDKQE